MATAAASFGVVLAAFVLVAPSALAAPTADWRGVTDTLVCVDRTCHIVSPPVDDARVKVGTSTFEEVRLTLQGPRGSALALSYEADGHRQTTPAKSQQTTGWLEAPQDRVLEVSVLDFAPLPATGLRPGVQFTLTAEYR
jgi:hypothetical protein